MGTSMTSRRLGTVAVLALHRCSPDSDPPGRFAGEPASATAGSVLDAALSGRCARPRTRKGTGLRSVLCALVAVALATLAIPSDRVRQAVAVHDLPGDARGPKLRSGGTRPRPSTRSRRSGCGGFASCSIGRTSRLKSTRPRCRRSTRPTRPAYDWTIYDRVLADARARDIRVLVTISGPGPRWATRSREDRVTRPSATRSGAS